MINTIFLIIGNISLTFTVFSSGSIVRGTLFPIIDFIFIFYLLVRTVFLMRKLGISQNLDDYVDTKNLPPLNITVEEDIENHVDPATKPVQKTTTAWNVDIIEVILIVYGFISYIVLIARAVTS